VTKRYAQHNGVWVYEVTLEGDAMTPALVDTAKPRAVPEASVVPCLSPTHMASWLTILSADWEVRS